eukprot:2909633-Pyramimonas_sp.AAC.1
MFWGFLGATVPSWGDPRTPVQGGRPLATSPSAQSRDVSASINSRLGGCRAVTFAPELFACTPALIPQRQDM